MILVNKKGKRQITIEINESHNVVEIGVMGNGVHTTIVGLDKVQLAMLVESLSAFGPHLEEWGK